MLCLCSCDNDTESRTSVDTRQEDTPGENIQGASDIGQEDAVLDTDVTDPALPDSTEADVVETDTPEPPSPPVLACPDIGLDASAGTLYYVCDCGTGADPDCVPGDDGNDGSAATPWRSYDVARQAFGQTLNAGDALLFRG